MKRALKIGILGGVVATALVAGVIGGRAWAGGIPSAGALTYSGVLKDAAGAPLTGNHNIQLNFWNAATGGETPACLTPSVPVALEGGAFAIPLPDSCIVAVKSNSNVWVEIIVDGASLGRAKVNAVPYAVEAAHAVSADSATSAGTATTASGALAQLVVPAGAVMAFDLPTCPAGWSPYAAAGGRVVIGAGVGLARGATVGSDQTTLSVAQMPAHTHSQSNTPHSHGPSHGGSFITRGGPGTPAALIAGGGGFEYTSSTTDATVSITILPAGGGQPFDNRQASIALTYCIKN
jgi:hypothetical protein